MAEHLIAGGGANRIAAFLLNRRDLCIQTNNPLQFSKS
jgi:hypothetical protein